jgi:hypothetical protein
MSNYFTSFFRAPRVAPASAPPTAREILDYNNRCLDTYKELIDLNKQIARDMRENTRMLMRSVYIRTCPENHALTQYSSLGGVCDVCRRAVLVGEQVMDCRPCNWYMCSECAERNGLRMQTRNRLVDQPLRNIFQTTEIFNSLLNSTATQSTELFSFDIPLNGEGGFEGFISQLETALGQLSTPPEDVIVTPTDQQITHACIVMPASDANLSEQYVCPIDLSPITPEENVMVIKHCKHAFRESNLRELFTRDVKCPMCRFDIRDHVEESESHDLD